MKYALTKYPGVVDGIFADRARSTASDNLNCINWTQQHATDWQKEAMSLVYSLNKDRGIVMYNNADFKTVNGRMFE